MRRATLFNLVFERVWSHKGGRSDGCEDSLVVAAYAADEAIDKLKKHEIGYIDEDEQVRIIDLVILEVRRTGHVDIV